MSLIKRLLSFFAKTEPEALEFKPEWLVYLKQNVPLYETFPHEVQHILRKKITRLIGKTHFEGCGGLALTDEIVLTIAAQACILIVHQTGEPYPNLRSVLVYPSAFRSIQQEVGPGGVVHERDVVRLGESWRNGTVILAWDSVLRGACNRFDGHNVTFHEFAHQLDQADGVTDGVPHLANRNAYQTWANVLQDDFEELVSKAERGKKTVMNHYGATNKAEFFAVATEAFFEKPRQLQRKQPELYALLKDFYRVDLAADSQ